MSAFVLFFFAFGEVRRVPGTFLAVYGQLIFSYYTFCWQCFSTGFHGFTYLCVLPYICNQTVFVLLDTLCVIAGFLLYLHCYIFFPRGIYFASVFAVCLAPWTFADVLFLLSWFPPVVSASGTPGDTLVTLWA